MCKVPGVKKGLCWCDSLTDGPQREWHYEKEGLAGAGVGLLEEGSHCGGGL